MLGCGDCIPNGLTTGALLAPRGLMKAVHGRCALFALKTSDLENVATEASGKSTHCTYYNGYMT